MTENRPAPKTPEDLAKGIFRNADEKLQGQTQTAKPSK